MPEINDRGNAIERTFIMDGSRYAFDAQCSRAKGWTQYDTDQDAWYFGVWVHAADRKIVTYAEGDVSVVTCPTEESFRDELASMAAFYGAPPPAFKAIGEGGSVTHYYDTDGLFGRSVPGLED